MVKICRPATARSKRTFRANQQGKTGLLTKRYSQITLFFQHKLDLTACAENIADSSGTMEKVPEKITLGLLQHACDPNPAQNLDYALNAAKTRLKPALRSFARRNSLPPSTFCQSETHGHFDLAEPIPGPKTRAFQELARTEGVVIVASLFEKRAAGLYHNSAVIIDADGSLLGTYRKMHIPDDPLYYEKFYFTPGDQGFRAWDTAYGRIGVLISLGSVVPRSRPPDRLNRSRANPVPHRHRLASRRESR